MFNKQICCTIGNDVHEIQNGGYGMFNIGPYFSKCFFSETTWTIETKLPRNDHWNVLYKITVFYADRKSKMAATAGHRLTLDPMENVQMPSSQKRYRNVHWMVLYNLKVFCSDMKFKMAATAGLILTLDPMGKSKMASTKIYVLYAYRNT